MVISRLPNIGFRPTLPIPAGAMPWEAITQLTRRWACQPNDVFMSKEWLLSTLVDVVAKGDNFASGRSPLPNGTFPQETIERLAFVGDWLRVNGEAIYARKILLDNSPLQI